MSLVRPYSHPFTLFFTLISTIDNQSPGKPYPVTGYASQASGMAPIENTQAARTGTANSGRAVTPRSSFFQEGRLLRQHTLQTCSTGDPVRVPQSTGRPSTMESPTRTWRRGDHLLMVPPSRPVSRTGSHIIERDPHVAQLKSEQLFVTRIPARSIRSAQI